MVTVRDAPVTSSIAGIATECDNRADEAGSLSRNAGIDSELCRRREPASRGAAPRRTLRERMRLA